MDATIHEIDPADPPDRFVTISSQLALPTLVDRDLVLSDYRVMIEYLDERFPHPPLLPADPISRARTRLAMYRIHDEWYALLPIIDHGKPSEAERARKELRERLMAGATLFSAKPFFLSDEFSLLDCMVLPLMWRLPEYGFKLTRSTKSIKMIQTYTEKMFDYKAFRFSLKDSSG